MKAPLSTINNPNNRAQSENTGRKDNLCDALSSDSSVRNAQASEMFRSCYLSARNSHSFVSLKDLDDLVELQRVRPSALLNLYALTGGVLGSVASVLPKDVSDMVGRAVDSATVQQFNDSIRDATVMSHDNPEQSVNKDAKTTVLLSEDAKEALKYHRDVVTVEDPESEAYSKTSSNGGSAPEVEAEGSMPMLLSTGLYQWLKVSRTL